MLCRQTGSAQVGDRVSVFMRPESFRLSRKQHSEDAWQGTVEFSIYHGDCWDYHVRVGEDVLKVRVYQEKVGLSHGDQVYPRARSGQRDRDVGRGHRPEQVEATRAVDAAPVS